MQTTDKIFELLEKAALAINIVSPTDLSELTNLEKTCNQIVSAIDQMHEYPAELLQQAGNSIRDAIGVLRKIPGNEAGKTAKSIEEISNAITQVQNLINQTSQADSENISQDIVAIKKDDIPLILDFIAEANEHIENSEAALLELENNPHNKELIERIFLAFHTIKGVAGFLNLNNIGQLSHLAESLLDSARKEELTLDGENINVVFESIDAMKKMVAELKKSGETNEALSPYQNLEQLLAKLQACAEKRTSDDSQNNSEFKETSGRTNKNLESAQILSQPTEQQYSDTVYTRDIDENIKVKTARLDNLVNMVGELVIAQLMLAEEFNSTPGQSQSLIQKTAHQGKIIRELQELSMAMRMVPIDRVFGKMARLVRDLSHKDGKEVNFITSGGETELDRTIVDKIADPLVHMIRNCIDHGIESPQQRREAGKNPAAAIELRAFGGSGKIFIKIRDDGKGLDKNLILKKAIDSGIVEADAKLADEEIYKLIFSAGLSTAEKVTNVSGRGMGMSIVKKNIESLKGKIDISSTEGQETVFTITLPLTLAIIDGQIVRVGKDCYVIPTHSVIRSFRPDTKQLSSVCNRGEMAIVDDELLLIIRLHKLFGITPASENLTESLLIIVEDENKKYCLAADELLGQQQVVIKSLGDSLGTVEGISGGAIMGNGKVSLILDVPGLMKISRS